MNELICLTAQIEVVKNNFILLLLSNRKLYTFNQNNCHEKNQRFTYSWNFYFFP